MSEGNNNLIYKKYYSALKIISGIQFTDREIEVVACLLHGKSSKRIALFLRISPRTVDTHIRNILSKICKNTREDVIGYFEESSEYPIIKEFYSLMMVNTSFNETLVKLSRSSSNLSCTLINCVASDVSSSLLIQLQRSLRQIGVNTTITKPTQIRDINLLLAKMDSYSGDIILATISRSLLIQLHSISHNKSPKSYLGNYQKQKKKPTVCLLSLVSLNEESATLKDQCQEIPIIYMGDINQYYISFFNLIKIIYPHNIEIDGYIKDFATIYDKLFSNNCFINTNSYQPIRIVNQTNRKNIKIFKKISINVGVFSFYFGASICLILCIAMLYWAKGNFRQYQVAITESSSNKSINSVVFHNKYNFLIRSEFLEKIENNFHNKDGIQTIALVGIGGSGKTTLARQYAQSQRAPVIWEINAETIENLKESFELLGDFIAKDDQSRKQFQEIISVKNSDEREEKVIHFVSEHLKVTANWLLIFDNVEHIQDVIKYLPNDSTQWGKGRIIITTRDDHIGNHEQINYVIRVGELSPNEKLQLFTRIITHDNEEPFSTKLIKEARIFLENIPSFPLDVLMAARFLLTTNSSYDSYLKYISSNNAEFSDFQQSILKDSGAYSQTRYRIISLAVKDIINVHRDFGELMLLICLLDSQNIQKDMLRRLKNPLIVDKFLYYMNKSSLIKSNPFLKTLGETISLHRSTQEVSLKFISENLKLKNDNSSLHKIVTMFGDYIGEVVDQENLPKIKNVISHALFLLKQKNLLTDYMCSLIKGELGTAYYYVGNYEKAFVLLEEALNHLKKSSNKDIVRISHLMRYMANVNREIGKHDEARVLFEKALSLIQQCSSNLLETAKIMINLGNTYKEKGNYKVAKELYYKGLQILKKHYPKNYLEIARTLTYLGHTTKSEGDYQQAYAYLKEGIDIYVKNFHSDYLETAWAMSHLACLYRALGKNREAKELLEQCYNIHIKHFSKNHRRVAQITAQLGEIHQQLGEYNTARILLEESLLIYSKFLPPNHFRVAKAKGYLGSTLKSIGEYEKAKEMLEESLYVFENHYAKDHLETSYLLRELGEINFLTNNINTAEVLIQRSLNICQENRHPEAYLSLLLLSDLQLKKAHEAARNNNTKQEQKYKRLAIASTSQAYEIIKKYFPPNSPVISRINEKFATMHRTS